MAPRLVRVRTGNGSIARVPETHPHVVSGRYTLVPSQRAQDAEDDDPVGSPGFDGQHAVAEQPPANASTDVWRDHAVAVPADQGGLTRDEANAMTRDDLVAHFKSEED